MNESQENKERLSYLERFGEAVAAVMLVLLFGFFVRHQSLDTGYFTERFGTLEMFALYVPLFAAIIPLCILAWTGRRNPARPYEVVSNLLLASASLWLVIIFPFDYSHLADVLPAGLQFILAWVTDDIAKVVFVLQVIIGIVTAITTTWKYTTINQHDRPRGYAT